MLATVPIAVLLVLVGGAPAAHASGYRYWSFWERDGGRWIYATQGPATARPADGDVHGFRFAVSEDSQDAEKPRGRADFAAICADTPERDGRKRVALVVDFGTAADAPSGESPPRARTVCASVAPDASTAEALAAVAKPLRYDADALLCAISGYPRHGCAEQVSTDQHPAPATGGTDAGPGTPGKTDPGDQDGQDGNGDKGSGPSLGLIAGIGVVVLLGAAGIRQARRRA